ncbi:glycine cleavage system protein GcvH [Caldiplasma sukawensis]
MSLVPDNLRYTKTHEWIKEEGENVIIGITDFAQKQITDIVFVDLPKVGKKAQSGKPLLTIESVKSAEDIISPVDGDVVEVNRVLEQKPEAINEDPYGTWIVKIKKSGEIKESIGAEEYRKFTGE